MHIDFIPYGERSCVERMLRDMEAQKHLMPMTKGKRHRGAWIPGQIRELPFGIKEYVFAKESLDMVLRTFNATSKGDYGNRGVSFKRLVYPTLRKLLKLKPVPKYEKKGNIYLWGREFVSVIVLGIREDGELIGKYIDDKGWTHEAL